MKLIKNYKNNEQLRQSLSKLTTEMFGLDFEVLYKKKYWPDEFCVYSIIDKDEVVSNICFHKFDIEKNNKKYKAIQIGTVATYANYRNQGLSRQLLEEVIKDYENEVDLMYLFANESVLEFYPKFAFKDINTIEFEQENNFEYLNEKYDKLSVEDDLLLIEECINKRVKNTKDFYIYNDDYIKMFYLIYVFSNHIYYHKKEDALIICEKSNDELIVHDIFVNNKLDMETIIRRHLDGVSKITYGFEVDLKNVISRINKESGLFVRTKNKELLTNWSYPETSTT